MQLHSVCYKAHWLQLFRIGKPLWGPDPCPSAARNLLGQTGLEPTNAIAPAKVGRSQREMLFNS